MTGHGMAGMAWFGKARHGVAWQGVSGWAWQARPGLVWHARAWAGEAWQVWRGVDGRVGVCRGLARHDEAGWAGQGRVGPGRARRGEAGKTIGGNVLIPILIGFGLLAVLLITDFSSKRSDWGVVVWLIILLAVGLVMWGLMPEAIGFRNDIYR